MTKRILSLFLMILIGFLFLSGCSQTENDLTDSWKEMAVEDDGLLLYSSFYDVQIGFSKDGMYATTSEPIDIEEKVEKPFPFEKQTYYPDYEIEKKEDMLLIKTSDDLVYSLKIKGDRLFVDEKNDIEYKTDKFVLGDSEGK